MKPWIIGWIASDGHNARTYWTVSQNIDDADALFVIVSCYDDVRINTVMPTKNRFGKKKMVIIRRNSREDCNVLMDWGIPVGDKTVSLAFPEKRTDEETWEYLRGMFEGDGSVSISGCRNLRVEIISSRKWCDACEEWLHHHGIQSFVVDDSSVGVGTLVIHSFDGAKSFISGIYPSCSEFRMGRKFATTKALLILAEHSTVQIRRRLSAKRRAQIMPLVLDSIRDGRTAKDTARTLGCSSLMALATKRQLFGGRKEQSQKKQEEIESLLRTGLKMSEVIRKGYGYKLTRRVHTKLFGTQSQIQSDKEQKICDLLISGTSIKTIVKTLKCCPNRVVAARKNLIQSGQLSKE